MSGGGGTPATTSGTKATGSALGTLRATVDAAGLRLLLAGKPVKTLKRGTYTVVVADRSTKHDFTLRRIGAAQGLALTGVAFTGARTVRLAFEPGRWKAYAGIRESATSVFFRVTK